MGGGTHGDQKRSSDSSKLELQAVVSYWLEMLETNTGCLQEQQVLLTAELPLQSENCSEFYSIVQYLFLCN